eukprot:gene3459-3955_t
MEVESKLLHQPKLEELARVIATGLTGNFSDVSVSVVDCPDLTEAPFKLAKSGLGGNPKILDVGGVPYLIPKPVTNKVYNFDKLAEIIGNKDAFFIGAGAGGYHIIGTNSEMMTNLNVGSEEKLASKISMVNKENNECMLVDFKHKEFSILGNFLASEGKANKVLKISASKRLGKKNFVSCIREIIKSEYEDKPVGLGGVFIIKKGKAKIHVMPDFSKEPLNSDKDVENWLKFYEMKSPLICPSVLVSHDPCLDLRVEHTHCFSEHGEGGHYHYDTTPDDVYYEGYYCLAEEIYRIDRPKLTHSNMPLIYRHVKRYILVKLLSLQSVWNIKSEKAPQQFGLFEKLQSNDLYDARIRPNFSDDCINITVSFSIVSIDNLDLANMDYGIGFYLYAEWKDKRLAHNNKNAMILDNDLRDKIWVPDTYIVNAKKANFNQVTMGNSQIHIHPDGSVYHRMRLRATLSCPMDLRSFPWDIQKCPLTFESYRYSDADIAYKWKEKVINEQKFASKVKDLSQYVLTKVELKTQISQYIIGNWSTLTAIFHLKRENDFFITQILGPSAITVCISWITFIIKPNEHPARIGLGITSILTIEAIKVFIQTSLPKVSYMSILDVYTLTSSLFVYMALVEYAIVLMVKEKHETKICKKEKKTKVCNDWERMTRSNQDFKEFYDP